MIADVPENFAANVQIEFRRQYVRFVRYKRKTSLLDSAEGSTISVRSGTAFRGSIGDFELFGAGAPRKAIYRSQIFDLGTSVNFGRLRWAATPLRRVGDQQPEPRQALVAVDVGRLHHHLVQTRVQRAPAHMQQAIAAPLVEIEPISRQAVQIEKAAGPALVGQ